jgi:hypothetical protein
MGLAKPSHEVERLALMLARARGELLAALDDSAEDVDLTVTDHGDKFSIRVEGRNCVSIWNQAIERHPAHAR